MNLHVPKCVHVRLALCIHVCKPKGVESLVPTEAPVFPFKTVSLKMGREARETAPPHLIKCEPCQAKCHTLLRLWHAEHTFTHLVLSLSPFLSNHFRGYLFIWYYSLTAFLLFRFAPTKYWLPFQLLPLDSSISFFPSNFSNQELEHNIERV